MTIVAALFLSACGKDSDEAKADNPGKEGEAGQTYNFKLAHIAPPDHIWNETAQKFAEELEERSDGRMKMELYPGGQLGGEPDMVQQLESGFIGFRIYYDCFFNI